MQNNQYQLLDVFKFTLAILIIALHCDPFLSYSGILQTGFRNVAAPIAVPCFFVISSFLFFNKIYSFRKNNDLNSEKQYVKKYAKRLAVMYLIWSLIYFPFVVVGWAKNGFSFLEVLLYFRNFFFSGSYSTLWFLPALLSGILLTYLFEKFIKNKALRYFVPCLTYLFCISGTTYYGLFCKIPHYEKIIDLYLLVFGSFKNGVLFALLPIALGQILSNIFAQETNYMHKNIALIIFWVSASFYILETVSLTYFGISKAVDEWIFIMPLSFSTIWILANNQTATFANCLLFRKMSILMFLTQRIPLTIFSYFTFSLFNNSFVYFLSILIITLSLSYGIIKLSDKIPIIRKIY